MAHYAESLLLCDPMAQYLGFPLALLPFPLNPAMGYRECGVEPQPKTKSGAFLP